MKEFEKEAELVVGNYVEVLRIGGTGHRNELVGMISTALARAHEDGRDDHDWCDKTMASEVGKAFDRGYNSAIEAAVKAVKDYYHRYNLSSEYQRCNSIIAKIKELHKGVGDDIS